MRGCPQRDRVVQGSLGRLKRYRRRGDVSVSQTTKYFNELVTRLFI